MQFNTRAPAAPPLLRIEPFKGLNLSVTPTQIDDHQSPDMLNITIGVNGDANKRTGYTRVFPTSLGAGKINGMFSYRKKDGTTIFLLAYSTKLYTQSGSNQPVQIYSGLADSRVKFFVMNDLCYILDGTNYLVYDGTTVTPVTPYIPTIVISTPPTGGGTKNEDINLLGAGFKQTFSGNASATAYQLALTNLDATTVTVKVNGVAKVEGTDFTVNRTTGIVTFTTAPSTGTNNVEITAYKTQTGYPQRIQNCTLRVLFGGSNDTRVFVSGNPNYPNYIYKSGLYDPTYFPENGFYKVGSDAEKVQGFSKQYDTLIIHKEFSKWNMQFQLDSNGLSTFPLKPINDQVGTFAKNTIQTIENSPVSLDKTGVYELVQSNVRDERNVQHISKNIDPALLNEPNLDQAISIDYDRKYWIVVNGNAYVYDYTIQEWFKYSNINANCLYEMNGYLYFGSSSEGLIYRFMKETEGTPYNDDGQPINAYWTSKQLTFGADEYKKLVEKVYFSLKPATRTSADLYYISNKKESGLVKTKRMDLLDFRNIDFNAFSFLLSSFPQEVMAKIKAKKITHFQLKIVNDNADESMGILSLGISYRFQSAVK